MPDGATLTAKLGEFIPADVLAKFGFTPEEESCISGKIRKLKDEGKPQDQAVAIAISTCAPSKAKNAASTQIGTFDATLPPPINIKGGEYAWTDTQDGYYVVHRVPIVSVCPKGTKGAPYDVTSGVLNEFKDTAQKRYNQGHFCATAYKGHNPDLPLTHPDFMGYVLPNEVGKCMTQKGELDTLFADVKIDRAHFEAARAGRLPGHSPEIPWNDRKVAGLAFLDTVPPYFEYPNFTLARDGKVDGAAKFQATAEVRMKPEEIEALKKENDELKKMVAKFEAAGGGDGGDGGDGGGEGGAAPPASDGGDAGADSDGFDAAFAKQYPRTAKKIKDVVQMMARMGRFDNKNLKPNALPAEPGKSPMPKHDEKQEAKMGMSPEEAAKFTALVNDNAELKAKFTAQEHRDKTAALMEKANRELARKIVTEDAKNQIAQFAAQYAGQEKGEEMFLKMIAALRPIMKDKPTLSPAEFSSAGGSIVLDVSDPIVGKFAKESPERQEEIARFAAQFEQIKGSNIGKFVTYSKEAYIKNELDLAKAKREGAFVEEGR